MATSRNPLAVTFSVWQAIFLREALDRLFDMRAAWFWLLAEPILHIAFIAFVFSVIRVRTIGSVDIAIWIMVGMLGFFVFRRTALQVMFAADSNRPLFAYRQVKPFDAALMRGALEAFLMVIVSAIILGAAALLGHVALPGDPLLVALAVTGLWLFAVGYGLVTSVLMALVPETEHILKLVMMPMYMLSGVVWPMMTVAEPYRDWLMLNPVAHGLELVRLGFVPYYHAVPGVSAGYLYGCAVSSVFLGLVLYRRYARQLVSK